MRRQQWRAMAMAMVLLLLPILAGGHRVISPASAPPPPPQQHQALAPVPTTTSPTPALISPLPSPSLPSENHAFLLHGTILVVAALGGIAGGIVGYLAYRSRCTGAVAAHILELSAISPIRKHAILYSAGEQTLTETIEAFKSNVPHKFQQILAPHVLLELVKEGHNGVLMAVLLSGLGQICAPFVVELADQLVSLDLSSLQSEIVAAQLGGFFGTLYERHTLPLMSMAHIRLSARTVQTSPYIMSFLINFFQHMTAFHEPSVMILEAMGYFFDGDIESDYFVWSQLLSSCRDTLLGYQLLLLCMRAEGSITRESFLLLCVVP